MAIPVITSSKARRIRPREGRYGVGDIFLLYPELNPVDQFSDLNRVAKTKSSRRHPERSSRGDR